ncbi:guanylate kinase [Candidatus Thiomargarita nelsonii]|uniref:Guanylate kinase n=1 Tax=Candidatus Thiomargarita nelsonii TaxID=1003181 RepID=A0A4E0QWK5_9GAMM|nr:guanylate kinase [Candidatus Thiomargarita nelsonii]
MVTLYTISAPSGAGKTTLVNALIETTDNIKVSISHTTRQPRQGEKNGENYHFVTKDEFMEMLENNLFLEQAQVFDNHYGTSQQWLKEQLNAGIDVILEIDWQGAEKIRRLKPDTVNIFILPPSRAVLEQRLHDRGKDSEEVIAKRLRGAVEEMRHCVEYDYIVINDDLDQALKDLQSIIQSQRLRQVVQAAKLEGLLKELLN